MREEKISPVSFPVLSGDVFLTLFMICLHASQYPAPGPSKHRSVSTSGCLFVPLDLTCFHLSPSASYFTAHSQPAAGSRRGCAACIFSPTKFKACCQMWPLPPYPFLPTRPTGSIFCCSWTLFSKNLSFTQSV